VVFHRKHQTFAPAPLLLAVYSIPIALGLLPWDAFRRLNGIVIDSEHLNALQVDRLLQIDRLPTALGTIGSALIDVPRWGVVWPILGFALLLNWRDSFRRALFYPSLLMGLNLTFYVIAYLGTGHENLAEHIENTIHRLLLHILPLVIFVIALYVRSWVDRQREAVVTLAPVVDSAARELVDK
jgi:uncharacterized membrane protein (GlpM family)